MPTPIVTKPASIKSENFVDYSSLVKCELPIKANIFLPLGQKNKDTHFAPGVSQGAV
jgi:hypothetical protein